jgi:TorA maturation chaperone TorD
VDQEENPSILPSILAQVFAKERQKGQLHQYVQILGLPSARHPK